MFGKIKGMGDQIQLMQKLMKDENFRAFLAHPKVQELFRDPEFQELLKAQDFAKITAHPKFQAFREDKELAALAAKLNFKQ